MIKKIFFSSVILLLMACSSDDDYRNNPNLVDLNFSFQIDLNLPQYNPLNFPGNSVVIEHYGINGIVIYNLNDSQYTAFELTDPNHPPEECSFLQLQDTEASCGCDDGNVYTIITGQQMEGQGQYPLKPYRVVRFGNILEVSN